MAWKCIKCKAIKIVGKDSQYYYLKANGKSHAGPFCDDCKPEARRNYFVEREKYLRRQGIIKKERKVIVTKRGRVKIGNTWLKKDEANANTIDESIFEN